MLQVSTNHQQPNNIQFTDTRILCQRLTLVTAAMRLLTHAPLSRQTSSFEAGHVPQDVAEAPTSPSQKAADLLTSLRDDMYRAWGLAASLESGTNASVLVSMNCRGCLSYSPCPHPRSGPRSSPHRSALAVIAHSPYSAMHSPHELEVVVADTVASARSSKCLSMESGTLIGYRDTLHIFTSCPSLQGLIVAVECNEEEERPDATSHQSGAKRSRDCTLPIGHASFIEVARRARRDAIESKLRQLAKRIESIRIRLIKGLLQVFYGHFLSPPHSLIGSHGDAVLDQYLSHGPLEHLSEEYPAAAAEAECEQGACPSAPSPRVIVLAHSTPSMRADTPSPLALSDGAARFKMDESGSDCEVLSGPASHSPVSTNAPEIDSTDEAQTPQLQDLDNGPSSISGYLFLALEPLETNPTTAFVTLLEECTLSLKGGMATVPQQQGDIIQCNVDTIIRVDGGCSHTEPCLGAFELDLNTIPSRGGTLNQKDNRLPVTIAALTTYQCSCGTYLSSDSEVDDFAHGSSGGNSLATSPNVVMLDHTFRRSSEITSPSMNRAAGTDTSLAVLRPLGWHEAEEAGHRTNDPPALLLWNSDPLGYHPPTPTHHSSVSRPQPAPISFGDEVSKRLEFLMASRRLAVAMGIATNIEGPSRLFHRAPWEVPECTTNSDDLGQGDNSTSEALIPLSTSGDFYEFSIPMQVWTYRLGLIKLLVPNVNRTTPPGQWHGSKAAQSLFHRFLRWQMLNLRVLWSFDEDTDADENEDGCDEDSQSDFSGLFLALEPTPASDAPEDEQLSARVLLKVLASLRSAASKHRLTLATNVDGRLRYLATLKGGRALKGPEDSIQLSLAPSSQPYFIGELGQLLQSVTLLVDMDRTLVDNSGTLISNFPHLEVAEISYPLEASPTAPHRKEVVALRPGAVKFLRVLKAFGVEIVLVSKSRRRRIRAILERLVDPTGSLFPLRPQVTSLDAPLGPYAMGAEDITQQARGASYATKRSSRVEAYCREQRMEMGMPLGAPDTRAAFVLDDNPADWHDEDHEEGRIIYIPSFTWAGQWTGSVDEEVRYWDPARGKVMGELVDRLLTKYLPNGDEKSPLQMPELTRQPSTLCGVAAPSPRPEPPELATIITAPSAFAEEVAPLQAEELHSEVPRSPHGPAIGVVEEPADDTANTSADHAIEEVSACVGQAQEEAVQCSQWTIQNIEDVEPL